MAEKQLSKWDNSGQIEQIVWDMRLADLPRGENRAILQRLYNGDPPFDPSKAEENNVEINRNFLEGTNLLAQARRQWNRAFLGAGNYFTVTLDSGPAHKRQAWGHAITKHINKHLKRCGAMREQIRSTGANVMLNGIAPVNWPNRRAPIPNPLPVASVMMPSDTDIDMENCSRFAVFREWTPAQLYDYTHGPRVDPGWNLKMVHDQLVYVADQVQKQPNATAYQYMPERIEELIKQDKGFWGSDAVPTIDVWDFYFRAMDDGKGWYRRTFLDWGMSDATIKSIGKGGKNSKITAENQFIYTSGDRKYSQRLGEILHCQFGDCSAYAPFKYHSVRSVGWMLWGICDLQNRLRCRFSESVFEQLMWFFRTASQQDYQRIKKAMFTHMGVIPQGISFVSATDRFKPDHNLINLALTQNRQLMQENASAYTQEFSEGKDSEMTASEAMARLQMVNAMVSGMLTLGYDYEEPKDREICRRMCIKHSPYKIARDFQNDVLTDPAGVPEEMLDAERWNVKIERVLGAGNKTLEVAQANQLQALRKNAGPDAQRRIDHISAEVFTEDSSLAEELFPVEGKMPISRSTHDAQLSTDRIMRGLPFTALPEMVREDYVQVWLGDMGLLIQQIQQRGNMAKPEELLGFGNLTKHIQEFLGEMDQNEEEKEKVRGYQEALKNLLNFIKGFAQRLQEQMKARNGSPQLDPKAQAQVAGKMLIDKAKADNTRESHALKTAQKQASFELDEQRQDRKLAADLRREDAKTAQELQHNRIKAFSE